MYSVDCIKGDSKSEVMFCGTIADSYNNNTEAHHHRTVKNLNDHWVAYNKHISLFNQIYNKKNLRTDKVEPMMA
jgi:hypothetical protein